MTESNRKTRYTIAYICLALALLAMFACNICIGSVNIPVNDVLGVLSGAGNRAGIDPVLSDIIIQIRMPRAIAAALLGGALALAGYLLQTFFHNPIAGPFVLGISSGAKFVVALMMVWCLSAKIHVTSFTMILAAFIGASIAVGFVLLLSRALKNMSMLIVGGIMIGYICTAVTDFVVTFADDSNIVNLHNWSKGSFSGITWDNVIVMTIVLLIVFTIVFCLAKPISAYQLGENYALNMGVNVPVFRVMLIVLSSILAAVVTAFAGPVSFVGIAVPHLIKLTFKTAKPIIMIPAVYMGGAFFCLLCDLLARTMFAPTELSISTVTAVFGAPIVIYMLISRKRDNK